MKVYVAFEIEDTWFASVMEALAEKGINTDELKQSLADGSIHTVNLVQYMDKFGITTKMLQAFISMIQ